METLFPPSVQIAVDLTFFLILTLELLQDNYLEYNTALCLLKAKKKKRKSICLQLEAELKCQNQHLFLKYSQCPQTCNFRTLSHHLAALPNTYTCTVTISSQPAVQTGNGVGQANKMPSSSHNTFQTKCNACKNANRFKLSNSVQQHVNEVFSAWIPKYTDYRMKNLSSMFSTKESFKGIHM